LGVAIGVTPCDRLFSHGTPLACPDVPDGPNSVRGFGNGCPCHARQFCNSAHATPLLIQGINRNKPSRLKPTQGAPHFQPAVFQDERRLALIIHPNATNLLSKLRARPSLVAPRGVPRTCCRFAFSRCLRQGTVFIGPVEFS
jgi:hypothetical protein